MSAIDHTKIESANDPETRAIDYEASRIAKQAAEALRQSRRVSVPPSGAQYWSHITTECLLILSLPPHLPQHSVPFVKHCHLWAILVLHPMRNASCKAIILAISRYCRTCCFDQSQRPMHRLVTCLDHIVYWVLNASCSIIVHVHHLTDSLTGYAELASPFA